MTRANLDCADKLVKRGRTVVWGGFRAQVLRVRTGRCLLKFITVRPSAVGLVPRFGGDQQWVPCAAVQVVA